MDRIFQTLKRVPDWLTKFKLYSDKNNLNRHLQNKIQPQNIQSLQKHLLKISLENQEKPKISWVSTEYQALELILNALSVITQRIILDFKSGQWSQIFSIFSYKHPLTVKYESFRTLMEKNQPRRRWYEQQESFLIEIVKNSSKKNKWNDVARQLYIKSQGNFFRQGKHCRDRWMNHLHPSIQNIRWQLVEDIQLLQFVLKKGNKWAQYVRKLNMKRSVCMVKKRFFQILNIYESEKLSIQSLKSMIKTCLKKLKDSIESKNSQLKPEEYFVQQRGQKIKNINISNKNVKEQTVQQRCLKNNVQSHMLGWDDVEKYVIRKEETFSFPSGMFQLNCWKGKEINNQNIDFLVSNNFQSYEALINFVYCSYYPGLFEVQNMGFVDEKGIFQIGFQQFL